MVNFNSHAHVERDSYWASKMPPRTISTHTLTWSVTCGCTVTYLNGRISTHTLTWSVTAKRLSMTQTAVFQLTRSRGAWPPKKLQRCNYIDFNSHAHVERDHWWSTSVFLLKISTHTLTWSVTQSTGSWFNCTKHFNSHAHVERDITLDLLNQKKKISTHTLTWSVT